MWPVFAASSVSSLLIGQESGLLGIASRPLTYLERQVRKRCPALTLLPKARCSLDRLNPSGGAQITNRWDYMSCQWRRSGQRDSQGLFDDSDSVTHARARTNMGFSMAFSVLSEHRWSMGIYIFNILWQHHM